jgi:hypothetical protein
MGVMNQEWRPVVGFEGLYEVSSEGRVRGLPRQTKRSNGTSAWVEGRVLKPRAQRSGHLQLWLRKDGKTHAVSVHRLVAIAFLGPCPDGMECCHNNGIPCDNWPENLRWDTRASNIKQSYADGRAPTMPGLKGLDHPSSRLTADLVREIRKSPLSCKAAAEAFGISAMTISRCRRGITYQEVA